MVVNFQVIEKQKRRHIQPTRTSLNTHHHIAKLPVVTPLLFTRVKCFPVPVLISLYPSNQGQFEMEDDPQ